MAPLHLLLTVALPLLASAHFELLAPKPIGFDEKKLDTAPCGGFSADFGDADKVSDFHVGGQPVAVNTGHMQQRWLYRATLGESAGQGANWTQLFPIVLQTGLNGFCEPSVPAPSAWAGKKGIVSVVGHAPDGLLYQCATVNFVKGTAQVDDSTCKNNSNVDASYASDSDLTALLGEASAASSASSTNTPNAAPSLQVVGSGGALGSLLLAVGMMGLGVAYVL